MELEKFYEKFSSNTLAGTSNPCKFDCEEGMTSYAFYKIFAPGKYNYSLLYSNVIDSTFTSVDGNLYVTKCNESCGNWEIDEATIIITKEHPINPNKKYEKEYPITFDGKTSRKVNPYDIFNTDPIELDISEDEYLCVKMTYHGNGIPCHIENVIPCYDKDNNPYVWPYKTLPLPCMVGCDRPVKKKIGFLGDSITQGIGCEEDSYLHYTAVCAKIIGTDYSFWNLGIGCAKAFDISNDGYWAQRAKHVDILTVLFGINDTWYNREIENGELVTEKDLKDIVSIYKKENIKVLIQTLIPFGFYGELGRRLLAISQYVREELSKETDGFFDVYKVLADKDDPHKALYGEHPNEIACKMWGEGVAEELKKLL